LLRPSNLRIRLRTRNTGRYFIKLFFGQDGELAAEKAFGSVTAMKSMGGRGSEPVPFCVMNQANFEAVLRHILLVRHLRVSIPKEVLFSGLRIRIRLRIGSEVNRVS
jgi:hypothetical protein